MIPVYTRFLLPADYGLLELIDLTINIIEMLIGLRIGEALLRYYHHYETPEEKQEVFTTAFIFVLAVSILILTGLQFFSIEIASLVSGEPLHVKYFRIAFICLAIQTVYLVPETLFLAQKKSLLYSSLSLGALISNLCLNIYFIVFLKFGVMGVLYSMLITKSFNGIIVCSIALKGKKIRFSWDKIKKMVLFGLPLVPGSFGLFIMHFSDRFFIQKFCGLDDLGIYSLGYKFGMIVSIIISDPIYRIWNTYRFEIANMPDAKTIYSKVLTYYFAVVIYAALGISVFISEIITIMASAAFHSSIVIAPMIVLGYVLYGVSHFFTLGIMITYNTKYISFVQGFVAVLNIILNLYLIKYFGLMGAALSTILSFFCLCVMMYVVSQKLYPVPFEFCRILILFVLSTLIFIISISLEPDSFFSLGLKCLMMIGFPFILLIVKFFDRSEIEVIKEKWLMFKFHYFKQS